MRLTHTLLQLHFGGVAFVRHCYLQSLSTEIPNFFTDEECEMIIDLAQEKGMSETPLTQDNDQIDNTDSIKDKFKAWDKNEDKFIDKTEVRISG